VLVVVADESVPVVVTPVSVVVSPDEDVHEDVDRLVDSSDVEVLVVVPATGPVTVVVVETVPVITGDSETVLVLVIVVVNVEVVLAELVLVSNDVVVVEDVEYVVLAVPYGAW
jgi:hypothetical protein